MPKLSRRYTMNEADKCRKLALAGKTIGAIAKITGINNDMVRRIVTNTTLHDDKYIPPEEFARPTNQRIIPLKEPQLADSEEIVNHRLWKYYNGFLEKLLYAPREELISFIVNLEIAENNGDDYFPADSITGREIIEFRQLIENFQKISWNGLEENQ